MKKRLCLLLCITIILSMSGCWSRKEPKTLAIVNSALYEYKSNEGYQITTEVLNAAAMGGAVSSGGSGKNPSVTIISDGKTVPEAIRNASENLEGTLFGGHNKARFFTESMAQKNLTPVMDYLLRDYLTDENPFMVVIKGGEDPQKLYSCTLGLSDTVGDYIEHLSKSQPNEIATSVFVDMLKLVKDYYDEGAQPVTGLVEIVEHEAEASAATANDAGSAQSSSEKKYKIKYEGLAAFKDNILVGYLDGEETRAYNFVTNNIKSDVISIPSGDDFTVFRVSGAKANAEMTEEDGNITIHVKVKVDLALVQEGVAMDVSQADPLKALEEIFNKQLSERIAATIQKVQTEFQSDIFGLGKAMHAQHPEKWKEIKDDWDDYFSKAAVAVTVESNIARSGQMKEPIMMED